MSQKSKQVTTLFLSQVASPATTSTNKREKKKCFTQRYSVMGSYAGKSPNIVWNVEQNFSCFLSVSSVLRSVRQKGCWRSCVFESIFRRHVCKKNFKRRGDSFNNFWSNLLKAFGSSVIEIKQSLSSMGMEAFSDPQHLLLRSILLELIKHLIQKHWNHVSHNYWHVWEHGNTLWRQLPCL